MRTAVVAIILFFPPSSFSFAPFSVANFTHSCNDGRHNNGGDRKLLEPQIYLYLVAPTRLFPKRFSSSFRLTAREWICHFLLSPEAKTRLLKEHSQTCSCHSESTCACVWDHCVHGTQSTLTTYRCSCDCMYLEQIWYMFLWCTAILLLSNQDPARRTNGLLMHHTHRAHIQSHTISKKTCETIYPNLIWYGTTWMAKLSFGILLCSSHSPEHVERFRFYLRCSVNDQVNCN